MRGAARLFEASRLFRCSGRSCGHGGFDGDEASGVHRPVFEPEPIELCRHAGIGLLARGDTHRRKATSFIMETPLAWEHRLSASRIPKPKPQAERRCPVGCPSSYRNVRSRASFSCAPAITIDRSSLRLVAGTFFM